ncbi:HEPN domain-containing protein [Streptosporangium sp. NPDC051022]|uniref:ApeA N-terminal domain 1-containing protein n=1 Tax=Streptosporangium sp. NPDC051022 TaxID=3155752 RepID=UPI00341F8446
MKDLDSFGEFWLPGNHESRIPGRLQFNPKEGIELQLIGRLESASDTTGAETRLFGLIDKAEVTLNRGYSKGSSFSSPGIPQQSIYFNEMFLGWHLEDSTLAFQSVSLKLTQLAYWIGYSGITANRRASTPTTPSGYEISYTQPKRISSDFSRGCVSLEHEWAYDVDYLKRALVTQDAVFRIDYSKLTEFDEIQKDIARLSDLVMLCIDRHAAIENVSLGRPDLIAHSIAGTPMGYEQVIEYRAPRLKPATIDHHKRLHDFDMLLTFSELGGINAVAKWLDASPKFQRSLSSLMSVRNTDRIYVENRFLNVTYAAEAFHRLTEGGSYIEPDEYDAVVQAYAEITPVKHRDWFTDKLSYGNEPPLSKRMRRLATRSRPATRNLIGDAGRWAQTISQTRNELTHLASDSRTFKNGDLYYLSESVYSVLRVCMLLESGVPESALAAKSNSNALTWHKERILQSINNIRAGL